MAAAALAALLAAIAVWVTGAGSAPGSGGSAPLQPPSGEAVQIVVEPAETPELELLALSIADLLRLELATREDVALVGDDEPAPADARLLVLRAEPAEWAGHAQLYASLSATPGSGGPTPPPAAPPPLLEATVSLDAFQSVRREVAARLARHLRLSLGSPSTRYGTKDRQAWLLYLEARTRLEEMACDGEGPAALLERSLDLDPEFAEGWYMLAAARFLHGNLCSGGPQDYEAAAVAARRAAELAPGWADPIQIEAGILLHRGRTEEAMRIVGDALHRFPDAPFVLLRASEVLRYAGLLDASARLFERVLAEDPAQILQSDTVAYPYLYGEEWERFLELLPARTGPFFRYYRGWAEARLGDPEAARETLAPAYEEHAGDAFARLSQALLAILEGRSLEALVTLEQLARQRAARQVGDGEMTFKIGQLTVLAGDPESGLGLLALAVDQGFFCDPCLEGGGLRERLAGDERYEALLRKARQRRDAFERSFPEAAGGFARAATS